VKGPGPPNICDGLTPLVAEIVEEGVGHHL
jgi:hypothetical protein